MGNENYHSNWRQLACALLHRAVLDASNRALPEQLRFDAHQFLMSVEAETLMELLGLNTAAVWRCLEKNN